MAAGIRAWIDPDAFSPLNARLRIEAIAGPLTTAATLWLVTVVYLCFGPREMSDGTRRAVSTSPPA